MATDNIPYPADPGTIGRREATRSKTEDAVTKQWPRVIVEDNRTRSGVYYGSPAIITVQASAHGAGAGFFWLINPVGSTVVVAVRRMRFASQHGTALATPTSPRIVAELFTFTGTASGATVTLAKRRTSDAAATASLRTANTGMTQTAGAIICSWLPVAALTAVGTATPAFDEWAPPLEDQCVLGAGEGLRFYQPDAGTASDTRRMDIDFIIDESVEF